MQKKGQGRIDGWEIARKKPLYVGLIFDQSGSMSGKVANCRLGQSKAVVLADQANMMVTEMAFTARREADKDGRGGINNYFFFGGIGYDSQAGGNGYRMILPNGKITMSIEEMVTWHRGKPRKEIEHGDATYEVGQWFQPHHGDRTPMAQGIDAIGSQAINWLNEIATRRGCTVEQLDLPPPLFVHVTDGMANHPKGKAVEVPRAVQAMQRLHQIKTGQGNSIVLTAMLSERSDQQVRYPASVHELPRGDWWAAQLFEGSPIMPDHMRQYADKGNGQIPERGSRTLIYNADIAGMMDLFRVGTWSAQAATKGKGDLIVPGDNSQVIKQQ